MNSNSTQNEKRNLAVVTGASDGLGKEFAMQLAEKGYDLIIIARRKEKLIHVKDGITQKYNVKVREIVCDLAKHEEVLKLEQELLQLDNLEFMVNNAGFGRENCFFPNVDPDLEEEMVQVHVLALMRLSRAALIPMCQRKKGYLINLASVAAFLHGPGCAQYNATKAYVLSFSKSIQCDVRQDGVRVQALCPGLTHTGFHGTETMKSFRKDKTPGFAWLSCEYVVRTSIKEILKKNAVVCVPSWRYRLVLILLCNPIGRQIAEMIYTRRARLAKQTAEKKD